MYRTILIPHKNVLPQTGRERIKKTVHSFFKGGGFQGVCLFKSLHIHRLEGGDIKKNPSEVGRLDCDDEGPVTPFQMQNKRSGIFRTRRGFS